MGRTMARHRRYVYKSITEVRKLVDSGAIPPIFDIEHCELNLTYRNKPTKMELVRALNKDLRIIIHDDGTYSFKEGKEGLL